MRVCEVCVHPPGLHLELLVSLDLHRAVFQVCVCVRVCEVCVCVRYACTHLGCISSCWYRLIFIALYAVVL